MEKTDPFVELQSLCAKPIASKKLGRILSAAACLGRDEQNAIYRFAFCSNRLRNLTEEETRAAIAVFKILVKLDPELAPSPAEPAAE